MNLRMLSLATAVTFLRPYLRAYSKAKRATRVVPVSLMILSERPASSRMRPMPAASVSSPIFWIAGSPFSNSTPA